MIITFSLTYVQGKELENNVQLCFDKSKIST